MNFNNGGGDSFGRQCCEHWQPYQMAGSQPVKYRTRTKIGQSSRLPDGSRKPPEDGSVGGIGQPSHAPKPNPISACGDVPCVCTHCCRLAGQPLCSHQGRAQSLEVGTKDASVLCCEDLRGNRISL